MPALNEASNQRHPARAARKIREPAGAYLVGKPPVGRRGRGRGAPLLRGREEGDPHQRWVGSPATCHAVNR
eukprot:121184-Chlamydomonas_euryale.AAC.1